MDFFLLQDLVTEDRSAVKVFPPFDDFKTRIGQIARTHPDCAVLAQPEESPRRQQDLREPGAVQVTPMGWHFVRGVALLFDRYLRADRERTRYSRIV